MNDQVSVIHRNYSLRVIMEAHMCDMFMSLNILNQSMGLYAFVLEINCHINPMGYGITYIRSTLHVMSLSGYIYKHTTTMLK